MLHLVSDIRDAVGTDTMSTSVSLSLNMGPGQTTEIYIIGPPFITRFATPKFCICARFTYAAEEPLKQL